MRGGGKLKLDHENTAIYGRLKSITDTIGVGRAENYITPVPTYWDEDPQSSLHI